MIRVQRAVNTTVTVTVKNTSNAVQVGVNVDAQLSGSTVASAMTNSQGKATFSLANGTYKFRTPGLGTGFFFTSSNCTTPTCTSSTITTTIPVVVTVADPGGTPKANVEVLVVDSNGSNPNTGWTDSNGHVSLSAKQGSYRFATPGSGQGFLFYSATTTACSIPGCTTASITWIQPVTVTVVDVNGTAQPSTEVVAQDSGGNDVNVDATDAQGHVSLSVPVGTYTFGVIGDGTVFSSAPCTVAGCTSATITLPTPTVVTVVNQSGFVNPNQEVLVQDASGNAEASNNTDSNGRVSFRLAAGAHRFETNYGGVYYTSGALGSCVTPGCLTALIIYQPCTADANCGSGFCVGGMCCNSRCNAGCGTCTATGHFTTCTALASGTTCRSSAGTCDIAEVCNGSSLSCPADGFASSSTVCRASAGACDPAETCTGSSAGCPSDTLAAASAVCRPAAGPCDLAEGCTGASASCPVDGFASSTVVCRPANGVCDVAETCTGTTAACPTDAFAGSATLCRTAAGPCDLAERCTGTSGACPPDGLAAPTTVCRASAGPCDVPEGCTGTSAACPVDGYSPSTVVCRQSAGPCDIAENCTGTSVNCPSDSLAPASSVCRPAAGPCDVPETCTGSLSGCPADGFASASTVCRAATSVCDLQETCSGSSAGCPGDAFAPASTVCRPVAGPCDLAENCTGATPTCPANAFKTDGVVCDDNQACTQSEVCQSGACQPPSQFAVIVNLPVEGIDPSGGTGVADAINNHGTIVGTHTPPSGSGAAFLFTSPGPLVEVRPTEGDLYPNALNDAGVIAGKIVPSDGSYHAVRYANGILEDLGVGGDDTPAADYYGVHGAAADKINNANQLSGYMTVNGTMHGFRYTDGVGFEDIGSLGGTITIARNLNDLGIVVGSSTLPSTVQTGGVIDFGHAIAFDDLTGTVDLNGTIDPTNGWTLTVGQSIKGNYVAGWGDKGGARHAYRLTQTTGQLDDLSGGWEGATTAFSVNSAGDVVGNGYIDAAATKLSAWVYTDQLGFKKLNDLIDPASGWDLQAAWDLNETDDIVGWGYHGNVWTPFRLNLSPQTLACGSGSTCGGNAAGQVCIWADGIVDMGDGNFVAMFGFQNSGSTNVRAATNQVLINGAVVSGPDPAPPSLFAPGSHPGAFQPKLTTGQTLTWTVEGHSASVSAPGAGSGSVPTRRLSTLPEGGPGPAVGIEGTTIALESQLVPVAEGIATVGSRTYAIFGYTNADAHNVYLPYGPQNAVSDATGALAAPSPAPPVWFLPETHHAALVYPLSGPITWTLGAQSVTLDADSPTLTVTTRAEGTGIAFDDGSFAALVPDPSYALEGSIVPTEDTGWGGPLPTSFSVASDGAATAQVPIWVSPGRGGIQPDLALSYNSHQSTRWDGLGPGWHLQGLSQITRCARNLARDGAIQEVGFGDGDAFCLDGDELIWASGGNQPTDNPYDGAVYRTEHDRFAKIVRHESRGTDAYGPTSFEVFLKDGRIMVYGGDDATVESARTLGRAVASGLPVTELLDHARYAWSLKSVRDRSGNQMTYSYTNTIVTTPAGEFLVDDEGCIEQHITSIDYGVRHVTFTYQSGATDNSLRRRIYVGGFCLQVAETMLGIQVRGPRPETGSTSTALLMQYDLTVKPEGLTNVIARDAVGISAGRSVTFEYENASPTYLLPTLTPVSITNSQLTPAKKPTDDLFDTFSHTFVATGDVNGDGFDDIVYYSPPPVQLVVQFSNGGASGLPAFSDPVPINQGGFIDGLIQLIDMDMDGKADFVLFGYSRQDIGNNQSIVIWGWDYCHNLGYDASAHQVAVNCSVLWESGSHNPADAAPRVGDFNGDGLPDITAPGLPYKRSTVTPFLGVAPTLVDETGLTGQSFPANVVGKFVSRQAFSFLAPPDATLNRLDLATGYGSTLTMAPSTLGGLPYANRYQAIDLNGDGLSDLVSIDGRFGQSYSADPTRTSPTTFLNTGNGFRAQTPWRTLGPAPPPALVAADTPLAVVDLNKDGFDDLVILSKDPTKTVSSDGTGGPVPGWIYPSTGVGLDSPTAISTLTNVGDQPYRVLDYNGDGRPDLLTLAPVDVNGSAAFRVRIYRNEAPRPLLIGMYGGLNDLPTGINYDTVGRVARAVAPDEPCPGYPIFCPPTGPPVVTQAYYSERDFNELGVVDTYKYSGPQVDLRGRGWLGVQRRRVVRAPIADLNAVISIQDTQYGASTASPGAGQNPTGTYDFALAFKPVADIAYYVTHGGWLDNTAVAFGVGTSYVTLGSQQIHAVVPSVVVSKKRTVSYVDALLASWSLAFDPNQWPSVPATTDTFASRSEVSAYDTHGNPTNANTLMMLGDGSQLTRTTSATYLANESNWLIGQMKDRTISESTPGGNATRSWVFAVDQTNGLVTHETYQSGIADEQLDTDYARNGNGLPVAVKRSIVGGETRTTTITYDDVDGSFPKQVTNALGQVTELTYHPGFGVLVAARDPNGHRFRRTYDGSGRLRSETGPDGTGAAIHYEDPEVLPGDARLGFDAVLQVHTVADSGAEEKIVYDLINRETMRSAKDVSGSSFNSIVTSYDTANIRTPSRVTVPSADPFNPGTPASQFGYDAMGRPTSATLPNGSAYAYSYSTGASSYLSGPDGQISAATDDGRGVVLGKSEWVQRPQGDDGHYVSQAYAYGAFGTLVGIQVTNGPTTTIGYDASGRRISLDDPDTGHSTNKWNGFGDLIQETDANHQLTTYVRDKLGRVTEIINEDGMTTYTWDSAPDGVGQIAGTTSPDNVEAAYGYDGAGRLSSQTWTIKAGIAGVDGRYSMTASYDSTGRPALLTYPSVAGQPALAMNQSYAENGDLERVEWLAKREAIWTVNARNARGQIVSEGTANGVVTTHDYTVATGMLQEVTSTMGGQVIRDLAYAYDGSGRMQERATDGQPADIFHYDTIDRLIDWQTGAAGGSPHTGYSYDDFGNLILAQRVDGSSTTSTSFTPGDGTTKPHHQIASSSLGAYSYDARGDQRTAPGRTVNFAGFGLPKSIATVAGTTTFKYDGSRARVLRVNGNTAVVTLGGLFERTVQSGQPTDVFYVVGEGRPVAQIIWHEGGGSVVEEVRYLHDDHVQSVEALTNEAGQVVGRSRFEPFGAPMTSGVPGIRLGYQGAEQDADLGLINMNGRIYDPKQFRFISADPLVQDPFFGQDLNRYAFARNSPLNYRDPSGFDGEPPVPQQADPEEPGNRSWTYTGGGPITAYGTNGGYWQEGWGWASGSRPDESFGPSPSALDGNGVAPVTGGGVPIGSGGLLYGAPGSSGGDPAGTSGSRGGNISGLPLPPGSNPDFHYQASAVGVVVRLMEKTADKVVRTLSTKAEAVAARRAGKDVIMKTRQGAHEVQRALSQGRPIIRHGPHFLGEKGELGLPHYQSEGIPGHTFWGSIGAFLWGMLDPADAISGDLEPNELGSPEYRQYLQNASNSNMTDQNGCGAIQSCQ